MPSLANDMGNLCSTPNTKCCKRKFCSPSPRKHERDCKRIKYTLLPQTDPDASIPNNKSSDGNNHSDSPNTLQRSNAIRRPGASRSRSSSPRIAAPARLQIRNVTPPPQRPTSIVPTVMLHNSTPSTNQTSLSRSTAPTSPTTVISSVQGSGSDRPRTLYVVDGEVIDTEGEDSPRLELRWIDALRAPGAGGYRTVVDVVEERRSGRLTVVNGRSSDESQERVRYVQHSWPGGARGPEMEQQLPCPNPIVGNIMPTDDGQGKEEKQRQEQQQRPMLPKRKPVPSSPPTPTPTRNNKLEDASSNGPPPLARWRRRPVGRAPIPIFATQNELLEEVEDARKILDSKDEQMREDCDKNRVVSQETMADEEMDWFWVDDEGELRYRRCGIMDVD
ncbi:MAG: hypothetical protein Q9181_005418 [Wetmoreana brouardii]